eukprot:323651_1
MHAISSITQTGLSEGHVVAAHAFLLHCGASLHLQTGHPAASTSLPCWQYISQTGGHSALTHVGSGQHGSVRQVTFLISHFSGHLTLSHEAVHSFCANAVTTKRKAVNIC